MIKSVTVISLILIDIILISSLLYNSFILSSYEISLTPLPGPVYKFSPLSYAESFPVTVNNTALISNNPYYIFIYNISGEPVTKQIFRLLSLNATQISPEAYWTIANLAGFFLNYSIGKNFSLYTLIPYYYDNQSNQPDINEIYLNISDFYAFPYFISFPPSDNISYNFSYNVIDSISFQSFATYYFSNITWHLNKVSEHEYIFYYTAYFNILKYVIFNGSNLYYVGSSSYLITAKPSEVSPNTITTFTSFIFNGYNISLPIIFNLSVNSIVVKKDNDSVKLIFPSYPPTVSPRFYKYIFYEYNVSIPMRIQVYNGSSPLTEILINGKIVHSTLGDKIFTTTLFNYVWSLNATTLNISVITLDNIRLGDHIVYRNWSAGYLLIKPRIYTTSSVDNNVVDICYNLAFSVYDNLGKSLPKWVFNHVSFYEIYKNNYADNYLQYIGYYYGLNELLNQILKNFTSNSSYINYSNWELLLLAAQIGLQVYNNHTAQNYTIALICKEGNEKQSIMQLVYIVSWSLFYNISNGSYYLLDKWVPWTYGLFTGFNIPPFYLENYILPYLVLNDSNYSYLMYNIQSFKLTSWWYENFTFKDKSIIIKYSNIINNLPQLGSTIIFSKYYQFGNIPIFIPTIILKYNLTEYVGGPNYNGPGGI